MDLVLLLNLKLLLMLIVIVLSKKMVNGSVYMEVGVMMCFLLYMLLPWVVMNALFNNILMIAMEHVIYAEEQRFTMRVLVEIPIFLI